RRTPGPRLHGELATQREDAALVYAPKLGVERGRDARMIGRLEVVAACDGGLEIPTGQVESRQRLERAVDGEVPRRRRGAQAAQRFEPRGTPDRGERVASGQTDLDRGPTPVPAHGTRHVHRFLGGVAGERRGDRKSVV